MKVTYIPFDDIGIASIMTAGDEFVAYRRLTEVTKAGKQSTIKECKYKLAYNPVWMAHSKQWSLRCHTRCLNEPLNKDEFHQVNEYLYLNPATIKTFKFNSRHVIYYLSQKPMT